MTDWTDWTDDELKRIGDAEELEIESRRRDGTLRKPVTIWVVRVEDDLYVRSVFGDGGAWYRNARAAGEGRIHSGGVSKDVVFGNETDETVHDRIDGEFLRKYADQPPEYVAPCVTPTARAATIRLVPYDK